MPTEQVGWICVAIMVVSYIVISGLVRYHRLKFRAQNIAAHGWPKPPLDADGDVMSSTCSCRDD